MIHVLTVHWKDESWIDIQLKYLKEHLGVPYRVYAYLNDLPTDQSAKFYWSSAEPIESHAVKLNLMAEAVRQSGADDDDWLIFLDGDAFPIADIVPFCTEKLRRYPLIAIQRPENNGDVQPHPSFCVTTVGFWREIGGDWDKGATWRDRDGNHVSDVGGNLLRILEAVGFEWYALTRSNLKDLHPVWFGVYGNLIYHHGAGFRKPEARADFVNARQRHRVDPGYLLRRLGYALIPESSWTSQLRRSLCPEGWLREKIHREGKELSNHIYSRIVDDDKFYEEFVA